MVFLGFLNFYRLSDSLGPLVIAIIAVGKEVISFMAILLIFLIPYGFIVENMLYPNRFVTGKGFLGLFDLSKQGSLMG